MPSSIWNIEAQEAYENPYDYASRHQFDLEAGEVTGASTALSWTGSRNMARFL